ncbi:hypothetical protein PPERSA_08400 [Pseudocohnilembus persalinus]|uniref:Uncharacterized protein n=1 Tax=Pseudocohnilembus persalinus TaxID=266149 RepID=A0A0V0R661_PSEPJ|nr:hypothetical protein PPERSA_08400 [Pseudocohnilembus persalinus]|eukprot:KRX09997.1 hypothetical protein PPERSA_08400 [Pseudocohnilembus persalinus]
MEEIEEQIVQFLRQELFSGQQSKDNPIQVIREMQGWSGLMSRPGVMKKLQNERSQILVNLLKITEKIRSEFDSRSESVYMEQDDEFTSEGIPSGHNFKIQVIILIK